MMVLPRFCTISGGLVVAISILFWTTATANAQIVMLDSVELTADGCIQSPYFGQSIIRSEPEFLDSIRKDASREACIKKLPPIDFTSKTLVGITFSSGYCRDVPFLTHQLFQNSKEELYVIKISYPKPDGVCRALSRHELWLLVPRIPEKFDVRFEITLIKAPMPAKLTADFSRADQPTHL